MAKQRNWYQTTQDLAGQIMDREPFEYDQNKDAMYQAYKDRYVSQGRKAMTDTMGQAAGLTGGYANSYAQNVGQQTYNDYLTKLHDQSLNLYDRALAAYNAEGQALQDKLGIAQGMYNMGLSAAGGSSRRGIRPADEETQQVDEPKTEDIPGLSDADYRGVRMTVYYAAQAKNMEKAQQAIDAVAETASKAQLDDLIALFEEMFGSARQSAGPSSAGGIRTGNTSVRPYSLPTPV